ncbi:FadR/GntR family transcriptional regulator [Cryobacterium sp. N21]|uniref:FadR/GntR family transcriptional regulator n=1 Tax=Cryobacterium sp. N21 TaxID=2048289 RepID=UPI000CE4D3F4|nr:FadR/GntR family transcriptional regulator [Cryobacterium sp. N21]
MPQPTERRATPQFSRVIIGRTSYAIVDQIKQFIEDGSLKAGDRLSNERDLCQQFGVSRVTVREALRILEANGLVEVRVGSQGGSFLTSPSAELVSENLAHLLMLSHITATAATEARQVFELAILPLVMQHATEVDIEALRAIVEESAELEQEGDYSTDMSAAFHVRLAGCTHNSAIEALMKSFYGPLLTSLMQAKAAAPTMGIRGIEEHGAIVDAIVKHDLDRARLIMTKHLGRTAERIASLEGA